MHRLIAITLTFFVCILDASASGTTLTGFIDQSLTYNDNLYLDESNTKANTYQITPKLKLTHKYPKGERSLYISNRFSEEHTEQTASRSLIKAGAAMAHTHSLRTQVQTNADYTEGLIKEQADEESGDFSNNQKFREYKLSHSMSYVRSRTQTLNLTLSALNKRYDSTELSNYKTATAKLASNWSPSKTIGISINASLVSTHYAAEANIRKNSLDISSTFQHSAQQNSRAAVGFSRSKSNAKVHTWYGNFTHSYQGSEHSSLLSASRSTSASGLGIEQITDKISGKLSKNISKTTQLSLKGSAQRNQAQPEFNYLGSSSIDISCSFNHKINAKWRYSITYQHHRFDGRVEDWQSANKLVFTVKYNQDLYKF